MVRPVLAASFLVFGRVIDPDGRRRLAVVL